MRRFVWILLCGGALAGCAGGPPTLSSVGKAPAIEPRLLPAPEWGAVSDAYQDVLANGQSPKLRASGQQRAADLLLERAELDSLDQRERAPASLEQSFRQEDKAYRRAIDYYERLLKESPEGGGNDRLLYQLARAYDLTGQTANVLRVLDRFVQQFGQSPYIDEVQYRRGELLFTAKDFTRAVEAYQAVVDRGAQGRYYQWALYKLGWSQYRLNDQSGGRNSFLTLLDAMGVKDDLGPLSAGEQEVVQDILRAIGLSLDQDQGERGIPELFERYGQRPYLPLIYQGLGELYLSRLRYTDAARTFVAFSDHNPAHARAPWFMLRGVEIYEQGRLVDQALAARGDLYKRYRPAQPFWVQHGDALWQQFKPLMMKDVAFLAGYYHAAAQRTKSAEAWDQATQWYRNYLEAFPDDQSAPEMHFLLAEAHYDAGQYAEAMTEYVRTAYRYLPHEKSAEAGYAALQTLEKRTDLDPAQRRRVLLENLHAFVDAFPDNDHWPHVAQWLAQEQYEDQDYLGAIATAQSLLHSSFVPDSATRGVLLGLVAQSQLNVGEFTLAEQAATEALAAEHKLSETTWVRLGAAIFHQGEQARLKQDWAQAAQHFLRVPEQAKEIYPAARFEAAMALAAAAKVAEATVLLEVLVAREPESDLAQQAREQLAGLYREGAQWLQLAKLSETLAQRSQDAEHALQWRWQAADAFDQAGRTSDAMARYQELVAETDKPLAKVLAVRYRLAELYRGRNDQGRRLEQLLAMVALGPRAMADDETRPVAARAALDVAELEIDDYQRIRLRPPFDVMLRKKKQQMQTAIKALGQAADYGVAEIVTAATHQTAMVYQDFATALLNSERPRGLDAEELEMYQVMLEEQAFPFEEQAITWYETNVRRVGQGIYDSWVQKSYLALAGLRPARYAKPEQGETYYEGLQ